MSSSHGEEFQNMRGEEEEVEVRSSGRSSCISSGQHDEIQSSNGSSDDCSQSEISLCDDGASEMEEGDDGHDDLGQLNECRSTSGRVNEDEADSQIMIGLGSKSNAGESYEEDDEAPYASASCQHAKNGHHRRSDQRRGDQGVESREAATAWDFNDFIELIE
jgi:hypothetical protein